MKAGDVVGGYLLTEDFRVVGAGLSEWTFARRDEHDYFLKRFLSPTYPDDDAPGSAATKARKRARCAAFEAHHRGIMAALAPVTRYGGNLVVTRDFFREGAKYYKVTDKIDVAGVGIAEVAGFDLPTKLVLLKTVAYSLRILHDLDIVHSDLKPTNVLIKKTERGHTTKLIDFDSSYVVGSPPPAEDIVGTMNYYSPELVRYIQGTAAAAELTQASDIFALGLIYAEYLTGSLPAFEPAFRAAAIAVLNGTVLTVPATSLPTSLIDLVERMLLLDPARRPLIAEVHGTLLALGSGAPTVARPVRPEGPPTSGLPSTLRGKGLRLVGGSRRRESAGAPTTAADSTAHAPVAGEGAAGHVRSGPTSAAVDLPDAGPDSGRGAISSLVGKLVRRSNREDR